MSNQLKLISNPIDSDNLLDEITIGELVETVVSNKGSHASVDDVAIVYGEIMKLKIKNGFCEVENHIAHIMDKVKSHE